MQSVVLLIAPAVIGVLRHAELLVLSQHPVGLAQRADDLLGVTPAQPPTWVPGCVTRGVRITRVFRVGVVGVAIRCRERFCSVT